MNVDGLCEPEDDSGESSDEDEVEAVLLSVLWMKALPARPSFQCPATATQTPSTMAKVLWKITPRRDPDICKDSVGRSFEK